jgi:type II secretory pathway pseudopilin PulG
MSYCPKCGAKLADEGATFCHMCGAQTAPAPAPAPGTFAPPPGYVQQAPPKTHMSPWVIVAIVVGVVFVLSILAAIAIPTFLGQRQKAQDASAKSLVRNAMTAIESAYVDLRTFDPATMTPDALSQIEPSITWVAVREVTDAIDATADAGVSEVDYWGTETTYAVGTQAESGIKFAVTVDKGPQGGNVFYIDGVDTGW